MNRIRLYPSRGLGDMDSSGEMQLDESHTTGELVFEIPIIDGERIVDTSKILGIREINLRGSNLVYFSPLDCALYGYVIDSGSIHVGVYSNFSNGQGQIISDDSYIEITYYE